MWPHITTTALRLSYRCHEGHPASQAAAPWPTLASDPSAKVMPLDAQEFRAAQHISTNRRFRRRVAPGELLSRRACKVTPIGGGPKGCEWTPYSAYR